LSAEGWFPALGRIMRACLPKVHKTGLTGYGISASLKGRDRARDGSDTLIPHGPRDP
jgi:hypothetical protein